jgi:hypothetical protein
MKRVLRGIIPLVFLGMAALQPAGAQVAMEKFGKNRLQFKNFKWRYYTSENFDIYFYDEGNELARMAAKYLEEEFNRITDVLGYAPYAKTEIYLYNSVKDLQQSNIGVNDNSFDVAGQTDFVKPQVEIAYPGTASEFKEELVFRVSTMLINDMMFGGSLSDMFQSSYLLSLPDWFMVGAARYLAYGWSVEMDDYMREFFRNNNVKTLNKYQDQEAAYVGQSIWNFIAERYGPSYISNILNLTRIIRNEERSISGTMGLSFKGFLNEWQNYYQQQAAQVSENYISADKSNQLSNNRKGGFLNSVRISPEGNYVAYATNFKGRFKVIVERTDKNKDKTALKGGYKVINQEFDEDMPLISWQDENTLGIVGTRYGKNYLWMYTVSSGKKVKKELTRINQIRDFDIAVNANVAVVSADNNGNNDLYLVSLRRNSIKRITNDLYDDIDPRFVPGTSSIVFSSNRTTDSIFTRDETIEGITDNYNIFIYNIDTTKNEVHRLTNSISKDVKPVALNENTIYYLSDQQGIFNIYRYDLTKGTFNQVTNFDVSLKSYDINSENGSLAFSMIDEDREEIYYYPGFDLNQNMFTAATKRKQYLNAKMVAERLRRSQANKAVDKANEEAPLPEAAPITQGEGASFLDWYVENEAIAEQPDYIDIDNYTFDNLNQQPQDSPSSQVAQDSARVTQEDDALIDTDNYVFDTDVVKAEDKSQSFLSNYRRLRKTKDIVGPLPYTSRFTADNVVTSFVIDPLMGFGIRLEAQMNDVLENHKFYGGFMTTTDLRSGQFYGEYRYLKHTIDFHARYDRKTLHRFTESQWTQKYTLNMWEMGASLPFSVTSRFTVSPFFATTSYRDFNIGSYIFNQAGQEPRGSEQYGGVKVEFIYDNSNVIDLNLIEGTRGKIGLHHYEGISNSDQSFSNFYLDFRNYQKIHRELIFATRVFYGRFFGRNKQNYLLGGVDNWILNKTNDNGDNDPLQSISGVDNSNILFVDYVTSLRGFNYNTFYGANALLFNAELRLPVVRYFYRGTIASNFFRNLQLIGFFDIGSSWTGASPFATENDLNTEYIRRDQSPFTAKILNFKNPWLSSYGFGVRTVLLGYYVKLDVAYPMEDYNVGDARFFVTLGYDF